MDTNFTFSLIIAEKARKSEHPFSLLIIDSVPAHSRAEYVVMGTLADLQQKLNKHLRDLMRFGDINNALIVVTNQVISKPNTFFGDPTKPIGGYMLGNTAMLRLYLRKSKGEKGISKLVDSPNLSDSEAVFSIKTQGLKGLKAGTSVVFSHKLHAVKDSSLSPPFALFCFAPCQSHPHIF